MEGMTEEEESRIGKKVRGISEGMEERMRKKDGETRRARLIEMEGRGRKEERKEVELERE